MDPIQPTRIAEGREAEIFSWREGLVLRLYRDPTARARADRELAVLAAVRSALPRVPVAFERIDWQGRPGIVMQRLEGSAILREIQRRPWQVWALARLCGRVHAELNQLHAPPNLPSLKDELRRRIEGHEDIPNELRREALKELDGLPDGDRLCHGDFQPDNVLLCATGPIVIDWPHATRGDSCGDFARTALLMKLGALAPGAPPLIRWGQWLGRGFFARAYVGGYEQIERYGDDAVLRWKLVRAVDRLADEIAGERSSLLRAAARLRRLLSSRPSAVA